MADRTDLIVWRFILLRVVFLVCGLVLAAKLLYLYVDTERGRDFLQAQSDSAVVKEERIESKRGDIVDRNGVLLAYSIPMKSVWVRPRAAHLSAKDITALAERLNLTESQVRSRLRQNQNFVYLKRQVTPQVADSIQNMSLRGVHLETEYRRFYPAGEVAAHVTGFTGADHRGLEGFEKTFDDLLAGQFGKRRVMKNARGDVIKQLNILDQAHDGESLALSLDMNIQYLAYRELKEAVQRYSADSASMVVVDIDSGEVLALVNEPTTNINDRQQLSADKLRNRALLDVFEPGSTVKPFTIAAALESGVIAENSIIDTSPGHIYLGNKKLKDPRNYKALSVSQVLQKSSQVGTSKIALQMDVNQIRDMFSDVGFAEYCATGYPGESVGMIPHRRHWEPIQQANLSFGYGMQVNLLQLARAYTVLANKGRIKDLTLLKKSISDTETATATDRQVISAQVSNDIVDMLVKAVDEGTGGAARINGYSVAGKTGTSRLVGDKGGYELRYRATFAGMVPADSPKYVAVITVENPKGDAFYGGKVAAPIFASVMEGVLQMQRVVPDRLAELASNDRLAMASAPSSSAQGLLQ